MGIREWIRDPPESEFWFILSVIIIIWMWIMWSTIRT